MILIILFHSHLFPKLCHHDYPLVLKILSTLIDDYWMKYSSCCFLPELCIWHALMLQEPHSWQECHHPTPQAAQSLFPSNMSALFSVCNHYPVSTSLALLSSVCFHLPMSGENHGQVQHHPFIKVTANKASVENLRLGNSWGGKHCPNPDQQHTKTLCPVWSQAQSISFSIMQSPEVCMLSLMLMASLSLA